MLHCGTRFKKVLFSHRSCVKGNPKLYCFHLKKFLCRLASSIVQFLCDVPLSPKALTTHADGHVHDQLRGRRWAVRAGVSTAEGQEPQKTRENRHPTLPEASHPSMSWGWAPRFQFLCLGTNIGIWIEPCFSGVPGNFIPSTWWKVDCTVVLVPLLQI